MAEDNRKYEAWLKLKKKREALGKEQEKLEPQGMETYRDKVIELSRTAEYSLVKKLMGKQIKKKIIGKKLIEARDLPPYVPTRIVRKLRAQGYASRG
jgi:hypothetical protein